MLYADVINFFVVRKCQKIWQIDENNQHQTSKSSYLLFWMTWRISMKFSRKDVTYDSIKSQKTRLYFLENIILRKPQRGQIEPLPPF